MTIEREGKKMQLVCNGCRVAHPLIYDAKTEFKDMIDDAKRDGWKVFQDERGQWRHHCKYCA